VLRSAFVSSVGTGGVGSDLEVSGLERGIDLYSGRVAVHDSCYHLLRHAIEHVQHLWCVRGLVELDVLVGCMISLSDDIYGMALHTTLDLGGAEVFRGIHGWEGNCTSEAWYLTDFLVECEGVSEYVENPPRAAGWADEWEKPLAARRRRHRAWRCFGFGTGTAPDAMEIDVEERPPPHQPLLEALPTELLVQILCFLPKKDVDSLCLASKTVAAISLPQEYWKSRFVLDAPYLWELHARMPMLEWMRPAPDWRRMHEDLVTGEKTQLAFRGLRNRERVWRAAVEVAEECWIGELCEREERGSYIGPATTYHSGPSAPTWDDYWQ
jgi:hypothetical protein